MLRLVLKSLILVVFLVSLPATSYLSQEPNVGSISKVTPGILDQWLQAESSGHGLPGSSESLQYAAAGHVLGFRRDGVVIASGSHALRVKYVNARPVSPVEVGTASEQVKGRGPAPALEKVTYHNLWDRVTVVYEKTESGVVKSTYYIQPGETKAADPVSQIRLRYNVPVKVDRSGNLVLSFATGEIRETRPVAWQEISGKRVAVNSGYRLLGACEVGFTIGTHNTQYPLVIDPKLIWNTFLGGPGDDITWTIAMDTNGNFYVAGVSRASWGSPIRPYTEGGDYGEDGFVAKLDPNGNLLWNTFLGGASDDSLGRSGVDGNGNLYVTGYSLGTWGTPLNPYAGGLADAFVAKLDTNGVLLWSTFLGGSKIDTGTGIAVDPSGNLSVTGRSDETWGTPLNACPGGISIYVAKLDTNGNLQWNTWLGGYSSGIGRGIAMDTSGNLYVIGFSFASWGTPLNPYAGGLRDAFVAKLDADGYLQWNTFLGGSDNDEGHDLVPIGNGNLYVTGYSPGTWGSPIRPYAGGMPYTEGTVDGFVAKLDADGNLLWNTFLGGASDDMLSRIAMDTNGNIYASGYSFSNWGSPVNPNAGGQDACVAKLDTNGVLLWNTYFGGPGGEGAGNLAIDATGNLFVCGTANATWGSPLNPWAGGGHDAFVVKLSEMSDTDGDGIEDLIDTEPSVSSNNFSDITLPPPGTTQGYIIDRGDQILMISDEPNPLGIRFYAAPGGGQTEAKVNACDGVILYISVNASNNFAATCGSADVEVTQGPVEIHLVTETTVSVPNETAVKITQVDGGALNIKNTAGTGIITIVDKGVETSLNPGENVVVTKKAYILSPFDSPIDNTPVVNNANAGSTIPVKWRITDLAGIPISDPASFKSLTSYSITCGEFTGNPTDEMEVYSGGTSGLQYAGDGHWQFNWKTQKSYAGGCRVMVLTLADGSIRSAYFHFK